MCHFDTFYTDQASLFSAQLKVNTYAKLIDNVFKQGIIQQISDLRKMICE